MATKEITNTSQWLFHKGAKLFHITKPEATDATGRSYAALVQESETNPWKKQVDPDPGCWLLNPRAQPHHEQGLQFGA
jgi:hypothetical protein